MSLLHPATDQIELATVLAVLGDRTRLAIVGYLARNQGVEINCSRFLDLGSKTNVSYHLAKLREAGVTRTEVRGTNRLISLRRADRDARFRDCSLRSSPARSTFPSTCARSPERNSASCKSVVPRSRARSDSGLRSSDNSRINP